MNVVNAVRASAWRARALPPRVLALLAVPLAVLLAPPGCASSQSGFQRPSEIVSEAHPWKFGRSQGKRLASTRYEIFTTLTDENLLQALPGAVETAFAYYRELIPTLREPAERMPVFIFARRDEFEAFVKWQFGARADALLRVRSGGFCERGVVVIEYVSHAATFPVLTHEGFHQVLDQCVSGRVPAWLNEGLATLCEGQRWDSEGIARFDGDYNPIRRNRLAEVLLREQQFPLAELLRINAGDIISGPKQQVGAYYSQLWALVRFLRSGERYRDGYARMAEALAAGQLEQHAQAAAISAGSASDFGTGVFQAFIAPDVAAFEKEYVAFMRRDVLGE